MKQILSPLRQRMGTTPIARRFYRHLPNDDTVLGDTANFAARLQINPPRERF